MSKEHDMNHIKLNSMLLFLAAIFVCLQSAAAQQYELLNGTFSNGGGASSNSSFQLDCTVGEPIIGEGSNSSFTLQSGFAYVVGSGGDPTCPLSWQANLTVRDAGSNTATLTIGQGANATNDLDTDCGEAELPPVPPAGTFDARLVLPVSPVKASLKDYRNDSETAINWRITFQPGTAGNMAFSWNSADFPEGTFFLKDEITGTLVNVNMKTQSNYTLTNTAITSLKIEFSQIDSRDVSVVSGWNIISVPLLAADMSVTRLFPDAVSAAFGFNGGYVSTPTLVNGKGYWLKFNSANTYSIAGASATSRDISVNAGWNIIGPFESEVAVSAITSIPAGIVTSAYFGYNNGYVSSTTLAVGKGYWVKASQAGTLHLASGSAMAKMSGTPALAYKQEADDSWPRIRIEDSAGNSGTLFLAPSQEISGSFELPPTPPVGIFDVRFGSNQYVESLEAGRREIQISSAKYPIKITAQNCNGRVLNVKDIVGGNTLNETLTEGKTIVVATALEKVVLEENALPLRFALSQNQPNPFNPTTIIKFALPEQVHVKITVYNTVGEKIAELVNQELAAGDHQVEFNALRYASGVYFYMMEAGTFKDLKKMLVVK
jgi:Secretion system C-terminal sorting domain